MFLQKFLSSNSLFWSGPEVPSGRVFWPEGVTLAMLLFLHRLDFSRIHDVGMLELRERPGAMCGDVFRGWGWLG